MKEAYQALKSKARDERQLFLEGELPVGTVYTPDEVADVLVKMAVKRYLLNIGKDMDQMSKEAVFKILKHLKVIDFSCGSGQLLLAYLQFIESLQEEVDWPRFLEGCIFAVDIDPVAIDTFKTLMAHKYGPCLAFAQKNVVLCNALIDALPFEGEKMDLVLGNPPYIGEKGNLPIFEAIKKTPFGEAYYEGKMDYFYFFIYKGFDLLSENGVLCYLTSNYFFTADGAKKLRKFLEERFFLQDVLDFGHEKKFANRKLHVCLYTLSLKKPTETLLLDGDLKLKCQIPFERLFDGQGYIRLIANQEVFEIIEKMLKKQMCTLGEAYDVSQGIVTGADRAEGAPIFVYKEEELSSLPPSAKSYLKPFYKNNQIKHYYSEALPNYYVLYLDSKDVCETLLSHLAPHASLLSKRREVINGVRKWYQLTWPRAHDIFLGEKIVVPQRAKANYFAYVSRPYYASADVYFITPMLTSHYGLKELALLLNSKLYKLWLTYMGKKKGEMLELYATPLKNMPLPKLCAVQQEALKGLGEKVYAASGEEMSLTELAQAVDELLFQAFGLSEKEIAYLKNG